MTADLSDSLGELRDQLRLSRADFRLTCDGFVLRDDHRSLLQLEIDSSSRLDRLGLFIDRCSRLDIIDLSAIVDIRDLVDCVSHLVRARGAVWRCFERLACGSPAQKIEKHLV